MAFKCIENSEITTIGDKKYLAIYLKQKFIPVFSINGNSIAHNPILIEEPSKDKDYNAISKLSITLNKLCTFTEEQQVKNLEAFKDKELIEELIKRAKEHTEEENQNIEKQVKGKVDTTIVNNTLLYIFQLSDSYETENEDFYSICGKFRYFLGKKIGYDLDGSFIPQPMLNFEFYEKYFPEMEPYDFQILTEELIAIYISFFLGFFRSKKLYHLVSVNA